MLPNPRSLRAPWRAQAACQGLASGTVDPWSPDEHLSDLERLGLTIRARTICAACPVRGLCLDEAIDLLPVVEEHTMRGGMTPDEVREFARQIAAPHRRAAQCGSRSKYVAGCRCEPCRQSHRRYEHERRLHTSQRSRKGPSPIRAVFRLSPVGIVSRRLGQHPKTARGISKSSGLKTTRVRALLEQMVAEGRAVMVGTSEHGAPMYARASVREVSHAA